MIPFNTPLERAQAYEIEQLKAELAFYHQAEKMNNVLPVWHDAKTISMESPMRDLIRVADARVDIIDGGLHVKGRVKGGLEIGYYVSNESLIRPDNIQAHILQDLLTDVTLELANRLRNKQATGV